jgi:hypothetical protein
MSFFQEGFLHITDWEGYDHMLFLFVLAAGLLFKDVKKLFWLATAFTLGHSVTLAMSALGLIVFSSKVIELLIPVTILVSALAKWGFGGNNVKMMPMAYLLVTFFGLIHGLGFSTYFKMLFQESSDQLWALFQFNVGVETGQLVLLAFFLLLNLLAIQVLKLPQQRVAQGSLLLATSLSAFLIVQKCMEW